MIILKCIGGRRRDQKPCTFELAYRDERYVIETNRKVGGFDCPSCGKHGLRAFKAKSPG